MSLLADAALRDWIGSIENVLRWCIGFSLLGLAAILALLAALLHRAMEPVMERLATEDRENGEVHVRPTWSGALEVVALIIACGLLVCGLATFGAWKAGG